MIQCLPLLLLSLCMDSSLVSNNKKVSSVIEVFNIIKDPKRIATQFSVDEDPLKFLVKYCEDDLHRCLDEVSRFENILFEELLFFVISSTTRSYFVPLKYDSFNLEKLLNGFVGIQVF
jgi:hypothetical protein